MSTVRAGRTEEEALEAVGRIPEPLYLDTYAALGIALGECLAQALDTSDAIAQARLVAAAVPLAEELLLRIRPFKGFDPSPDAHRFRIRENPSSGSVS